MAIDNCVCCQGETGSPCDSSVTPPTCRGVELPVSLTMLVTDKTGTCTCYGDSYVLTLSGGAWFAATEACPGSGEIPRLECVSGDWLLSIGGTESVFAITANCDPFQLTFQVTHGDIVCTGSINVLIVETP